MKKFVELGMEVSKIILDSQREGFFAYISASDIPEKDLEFIGKSLYENEAMYKDYKELSHLDGFEWLESKINSYDFVYCLVEKVVNSLDSFYWCDESEQYIKRIDMPSNIEVKDFVSTIEKDFIIPKVLVLDEKEDECIVISSSNNEYICLERVLKMIDIEPIEFIDSECFVDSLSDIIESYSNLKLKISNMDDNSLSNEIWEYVLVGDVFKDVELFLIDSNNADLKTKFFNVLRRKLAIDIPEDKKLVWKKCLILYREDFIESIEESDFDMMNALVSEVVDEVLYSYFMWSNKHESWILRTPETIFCNELESRLHSLMDDGNFNVYGVLDKHKEYEIIKNYITNEITEAICNGCINPVKNIKKSYCDYIVLNNVDDFINSDNSFD